MLSSSVLQLADSPWLSSTWSLSQLQHFEHEHGSATPPEINPYTLADHANLQGGGAVDPSSVPTNLVPNQTLFSLGIALLEISFQQQITELRQPEDLDSRGKAHAFTDNLTAARLLTELENDKMEAPVYTQAVRCCLFGTFRAIGPTFENTAFQDQFYGQVVRPLLEVYKVLK
jgi:hypothetical protein